eukprot:jgi/Psemu1/286289/fgenesh1_pg.129_\
MTMSATNNEDLSKKLARLLREAASKAIAEGDPWAKHEIDKIPAERVIRHMYQPETQTWKQDETIVKMEREPFTHGAMRFCYRMKKRSPPPQSSSNHRFHDYGWTRASNFVAKAYLDEKGEIDTSEEAKQNVRNDILLQYEASHWSSRFNDRDPPKKIIFIRAYAIEFPNREGKPWFAVERYIFGNDMYGAGFTKHNTNAGFVDDDLHRITPQVFSAFSFYESQGTRLVADVQGVGNLFTDPQVLSNDYRFGDGDLGPRGMALFFKTFRHNTVASAMGIPVFPLSKNELEHQSKYEDDEFSMSAENSSVLECLKDLNSFERMDLNRGRRQSVCTLPPRQIIPDEMKETEIRSNQIKIDKTTQEKRRVSQNQPNLKRTSSEVNEIQNFLNIAREDFQFDMKVFLRRESGELMAKVKEPRRMPKRSSLLIRKVSAPIEICDTTKVNLGRVHYQLAILHGMGRFPEVVPSSDSENAASHDVFSVLFHLCHAASLKCAPACLALGRILAGLGTAVSELLDSFVPIDFEAAKDLLKRAMDSELPPNAPKVAAGCVLYQIYLDEASIAREGIKTDNDDNDHGHAFNKQSVASDLVLITLLQDILDLMAARDEERKSNSQFKDRKKSGSHSFQVGDKVQGNYCLEGSYYSGIVDSLAEDGTMVNIKYDDDGTIECLSLEHVRMMIPPTATQTELGGPLTDEEAGFGGGGDDTITIESYKLRADLAELVASTGDKTRASELYEEAAHEAIDAKKMKMATEWSLKASELLG